MAKSLDFLNGNSDRIYFKKFLYISKNFTKYQISKGITYFRDLQNTVFLREVSINTIGCEIILKSSLFNKVH